MTDITELAQSLKAAAEKATPGRIGDRIDGSGSIKYQCFGNDGSLVLQTDHKNMEYGFIGPNAEADELFFRECAPENILALVEALEKAQAKADVYDMLMDDYGLREKGVGLADFVDWQANRIAELESRVVKIVDCDYEAVQHMSGGSTDYCHGFVDGTQNAIGAITAAGIKVEAE